MGRGFNGLGGFGCIDRESAINRFRRSASGTSSMKRPRSDHRRLLPQQQGRGEIATTKHQRRVASICLLTGLALVASSWTVKIPTAGYDDDRRLSSSAMSSSTIGAPRHGPIIDEDGVKHFTPHGPYFGRFDRNDARRLELEIETEGIGNGINHFFAGIGALGSAENPYRSHRRITEKGNDLSVDGATGERTLASKHKAPKRIAVVRPFAPFSAAEITQSFDTWDTYWPCTSNPLHPFDTESEPGESTSEYDYEYVVDLYLSFSQTYANVPPSDLSHSVKEALQQKFKMNGGWNGCFDKLYNIGTWDYLDHDRCSHICLYRFLTTHLFIIIIFFFFFDFPTQSQRLALHLSWINTSTTMCRPTKIGSMGPTLNFEA